MKKINAYICFNMIIFLCSCSIAAPVSEIETYVADFYKADYDYIKTTEVLSEDGSIQTMVMEGQITHSPYTEHVKITSADSKSAWTEAYYEGNEKMAQAKILSNGKWIEQIISIAEPYGYGEKLTFTFDRSDTLDGKRVDVYTAYYLDDISSAFRLYGLKEELTARVKQEYYVDVEEKHLVRIVTDFSELIRVTNVGNYMALNGLSREEAEEKSREREIYRKEVLEILNYGGK